MAGVCAEGAPGAAAYCFLHPQADLEVTCPSCLPFLHRNGMVNVRVVPPERARGNDRVAWKAPHVHRM